MENKRPAAQAGFTLLEVLVAFIILGLAAGAVMTAFGSGALKVAQAENERRAALAARSVLALAGSGIPLEAGTQQGTMPDGTRWRMIIRPYEAQPAEGGGDDVPPVTVAYRVDVAVEPTSGAMPVSITSLRLKPGAP